MGNMQDKVADIGHLMERLGGVAVTKNDPRLSSQHRVVIGGGEDARCFVFENRATALNAWERAIGAGVTEATCGLPLDSIKSDFSSMRGPGSARCITAHPYRVCLTQAQPVLAYFARAYTTGETPTTLPANSSAGVSEAHETTTTTAGQQRGAIMENFTV